MGTDSGGELLHLIGGGLFRHEPSYLNASWPLVSLIATDDGISIGLRGRWRPLANCRARFGWGDLVAMQLSRRTACWYDRDRFLYRFVAVSDGPTDELGDVLTRYETTFTVVSRTWTRPFQDD